MEDVANYIRNKFQALNVCGDSSDVRASGVFLKGGQLDSRPRRNFRLLVHFCEPVPCWSLLFSLLVVHDSFVLQYSLPLLSYQQHQCLVQTRNVSPWRRAGKMCTIWRKEVSAPAGNLSNQVCSISFGTAASCGIRNCLCCRQRDTNLQAHICNDVGKERTRVVSNLCPII